MIKNPFRPGDPAYDMAFNFFAMEEEGLLPTHRGALNALCNAITYDGAPLPETTEELIEYGIDWTITPDDLDYIYKRTGYYLSF